MLGFAAGVVVTLGVLWGAWAWFSYKWWEDS